MYVSVGRTCGILNWTKLMPSVVLCVHIFNYWILHWAESPIELTMVQSEVKALERIYPQESRSQRESI